MKRNINRRDFLYGLGSLTAAPLLGSGCNRDSNPDADIFKTTNTSKLKIMLVGIDGATFDIIEPMQAAGKLPAIKQLMNKGAHSRLRSLEPMLSPALWTTIASGRRRANHNIKGFVSSEPGRNQNVSLVSTSDRKTLALWNIVSPFNKSVNTTGWWVTWPAEPVRGFCVSDRVAHSRIEAWTNEIQNNNLTFPPELLTDIRQFIVDPDNPPMDEINQLVELTAAEKTEMITARKPIFAHGPSVFKYGYCAQRTYENIALHKLQQSQPDLGMVFLIAVDPICHTYWHYYRPQNFKSAINPDDAKRLGRLIPAMYEHNDQYISKLQPHIDQDTVVIIVSDHGFHGTGQIPKPSSVINYKKMGIDHVEKLDKSVMTGMSGWHDINGVFIASGGPILPGAKPKTQPSLLDITPTILALMGLPVARDMPGRVLKELIDPKFFAKHPVKYIDSYEGIIKRHQPSDSEATGENAQLEYLRSLGYVK